MLLLLMSTSAWAGGSDQNGTVASPTSSSSTTNHCAFTLDPASVANAQAALDEKISVNNAQPNMDSALQAAFLKDVLREMIFEVQTRSRFLAKRWTALATEKINSQPQTSRRDREAQRLQVSRAIQHAQEAFVQHNAAEVNPLVEALYKLWFQNPGARQIPMLDTFKNILRGRYRLYVNDLQVIFPVDITKHGTFYGTWETSSPKFENPEAKSSKSSLAENLSIEDILNKIRVEKGANGYPKLDLPTRKAHIQYDPVLSSFVVQRLESSFENELSTLITAVGIHGMGAYSSYSGGYLSLLWAFEKAGIDFQGFDLPYALGEGGLSLRNIKDPLEIYLLLSQSLEQFKVLSSQDKALVTIPRSFGSSLELFRLGLLHLINKEREKIQLDPIPSPSAASVITSLTNPRFIEVQTKNALAQEGKNSTAQKLVPEQFAHMVELSRKILQIFDQALKENPKAFDDFGSEILVIMGENDVDALPANHDHAGIYNETSELLRRYAPRARFYFMQDPRVTDEIRATTTDPYALPAGHFIVSPAAGNADQLQQVVALTFGFMDELCDQPGKIPEAKRQALRSQRTLRTQHLLNETASEDNAYLRAYFEIKNREPSKRSPFSLEAIGAGLSDPSQGDLARRYRDVYDFFHGTATTKNSAPKDESPE